MKTKILLGLFLFSFILTINAQLIFKSRVIEEGTNNPVKGIIVKIEGTEFAVKTNDEGVFSFNGKLSEGEHYVSISSELYKLKVFSILYKEGVNIKVEEVKIALTKKEAKRRKKEKKEKDKLIAARINKIAKDEKRRKKLLKKKKKELSKENTVVVEYNVEEKEALSEEERDNQMKYAKILGVDPLVLSNKKLYAFIDKWLGTPYKMGGSSKDAIDCSAFTQRLMLKAKGLFIDRTAQKQFNSIYTDKFKNKEYLREGDLLFFGSNKNNITHVGMYLHNNKFVHATSRGVDGPSGVKISDITHPFWTSIFISAGRRINNE